MSTTVSQDREFIESVISTSLLEDSIDWISKNMSPGEVFVESDLDDWAEANGYVKQPN